MWKTRLLGVVLAILSSGLIIGGIIDGHKRDSGERVSVKVTDCHLEDAGQTTNEVCDGTWISGGPLLSTGHVVLGTIDGATSDDIGKTLNARAHGDHAYLPSHRFDYILIGLGSLMVVTFLGAAMTASEDRARRRQAALAAYRPARHPRAGSAMITFSACVSLTAGATVGCVALSIDQSRARPAAVVAQRTGPIKRARRPAAGSPATSAAAPPLALGRIARTMLTPQEPSHASSFPIDVTVIALRRGRPGAARGHDPFLLDPGVSVHTAVPYYVTVRFANPGPRQIPSSINPYTGLQVIDSAGAEHSDVVLGEDLPMCPNALARLTHAAARYRTCALFLLAPAQRITGISWTDLDHDSRDPVRWKP
jgi:hypothetical protein